MAEAMFQLTDDRKLKALQDVSYEMEQLALCFVFLRLPVGPVLGNACLEALLVHVRLLLGFFEQPADQRTKDDVLSEDYGLPARKLDLDEQVRTRLHKDLAHLTYDRTNRVPPDTLWPLDALVPVILRRSNEFVQLILSDFLDEGDTERRESWSRLTALLSNVSRSVEQAS